MSDRETASIDLSRSEARVVIAALVEAEMTASGNRATRLRDTEERLSAEFEFDEHRGRDRGDMAGDDEGWFDREWFGDSSDEDSEKTIELSRAEADHVADALADFEMNEEYDDAAAADDVRERIRDAFGGGR